MLFGFVEQYAGRFLAKAIVYYWYIFLTKHNQANRVDQNINFVLKHLMVFVLKLNLLFRIFSTYSPTNYLSI